LVHLVNGNGYLGLNLVCCDIDACLVVQWLVIKSVVF